MAWIRFVVRGALLVALLAGVCAAQTGNQRQQLEADADWTYGPSIKGMPQKSVPAVEVPRTTYVEMLGRGYARIGEFTYDSEKHGHDVGRCKQDMLEMAMLHGGDVAWVYASADKREKDTWVDDHTVYYTTSSGTATSHTTPGHYRHKKVKHVFGSVVYFVHNPELAAKQLEEGRKKWEMRAAAIPGKRSGMVAMLDTVLIKLSAMPASQIWPWNRSKEKYISGIRAAQDELKQGKWGLYDTWPRSFRDTLERTKMEDGPLPGLGTFSELINFVNNYESNHWAESAQLGELHQAVSAARVYAYTNWDIIIDQVTLNSAEHFCPY